MQLKRLAAAFVFMAVSVSVLAQTGFKPTWAAPKKAPAAAALRGEWTMASIGGEAVSPNDPPLKIEFRPGNSNVGDYLITRGADEVEAGEFRLTETPSGLQVDFGPAMGDNAGKIQLGILKLEGPKLTWCMSPAGSEHRPMAFTNAAATSESEGSTVIEAVRAETPSATPAKPAPALLESIQGKWKLKAINGTEAGADTTQFYTFEGDQWASSTDGEIHQKGHIAFVDPANPSQAEWVLDWQQGSKAKMPLSFPAIVELGGTVLRVCWGFNGHPRPTEFKYTSSSGPGTALLQLMRVEAGAPKSAVSLLQAIRGKWQLPDGSVYTFEVPAGEWIGWNLTKSGSVIANGDLQLDEKKQPVQVTWMQLWSSTEGPGPSLSLGILELSGDTLRICKDPVRKATRPKKFESVGGTVLETMVRVASSTPAPQAAPRLSAGNPATALQGTWTVTSFGGRTIAPQERATTFVFDGQEFRYEDGGVVVLLGSWQINPRTSPATIDITVLDKNRQPTGEVVLGLIEVNGNTLRLANGDPNTPRPKSFASSKDTDGIDSSLAIAERR